MKTKVLKSLTMINEDTIEVVFKDDILVTLEDMKDMYEDFDTYTGGKRIKRLVIAGKHTDLTKEARKYGEEENEKRKDTCIAEAMVVYTFIQKMITNFYLKYIKDLYPTRSFTNLEEAREWILNYEEEPNRVLK